MAIKIKCVKIFRRPNKSIYGYRIQSEDGQLKDVNPIALKNLISNGTLEATNLTLTSDGRLVKHDDKNEVKIDKSKVILEAKKYTIIGYKTVPMRTPDGNVCFIRTSEANNILYIPENVKIIKTNDSGLVNNANNELYKKLKDSSKTLIVEGGSGLVSGEELFYEFRADRIIIKDFNTSNMKNMRAMFSYCKSEELDLRSFDTSNVTSMESMFHGCKAKNIDLSSFDTKNVENMSKMFYYSDLEYINISNFKLDKIRAIYGMFRGCKAKHIELPIAEINEPISIDEMFHGVGCSDIEVNRIKIKNVSSMRRAFAYARIKELDLTDWGMYDNTSFSSAFFNSVITSLKLPKNHIKSDLNSTFAGSTIENLDTGGLCSEAIGETILISKTFTDAAIRKFVINDEVLLLKYLFSNKKEISRSVVINEMRIPEIVKCIGVDRVGSEVISYILKDKNGNERHLGKDAIIEAIAQRLILVNNLRLTNDRKLVKVSESRLNERYKAIVTDNSSFKDMIDNDIKSGSLVIKVDSSTYNCYISYNNTEDKYKLYIPNYIEHIRGGFGITTQVEQIISNIKSDIDIIGAQGLSSIELDEIIKKSDASIKFNANIKNTSRISDKVFEEIRKQMCDSESTLNNVMNEKATSYRFSDKAYSIYEEIKKMLYNNAAI